MKAECYFTTALLKLEKRRGHPPHAHKPQPDMHSGQRHARRGERRLRSALNGFSFCFKEELYRCRWPACTGSAR